MATFNVGSKQARDEEAKSIEFGTKPSASKVVVQPTASKAEIELERMPLDKTSDQASLLNVAADEEKGKTRTDANSEMHSPSADERRTTAARAAEVSKMKETKE